MPGLFWIADHRDLALLDALGGDDAVHRRADGRLGQRVARPFERRARLLDAPLGRAQPPPRAVATAVRARCTSISGMMRAVKLSSARAQVGAGLGRGSRAPTAGPRAGAPAIENSLLRAVARGLTASIWRRNCPLLDAVALPHREVGDLAGDGRGDVDLLLGLDLAVGGDLGLEVRALHDLAPSAPRPASARGAWPSRRRSPAAASTTTRTRHAHFASAEIAVAKGRGVSGGCRDVRLEGMRSHYRSGYHSRSALRTRRRPRERRWPSRGALAVAATPAGARADGGAAAADLRDRSAVGAGSRPPQRHHRARWSRACGRRWCRMLTTAYMPGEPPARTPLSTQHGSGSGVLVSEDGYIVTNAHVVAGARRVQVVLAPPGPEPAAPRSILKTAGPDGRRPGGRRGPGERPRAPQARRDRPPLPAPRRLGGPAAGPDRRSRWAARSAWTAR